MSQSHPAAALRFTLQSAPHYVPYFSPFEGQNQSKQRKSPLSLWTAAEKLITNNRHTLRCPQMNHSHRRPARDKRLQTALPTPTLQATIFTAVQRNLCRHHNPLSSACKCLQAGAERRGAAAPLRTVGVRWYADHTRQGRGRHRVMMLRVHGEWRRMNG